MDNTILSEVIEVERELQKSLELEQVKALDWLATVKKECANEVLAAEVLINDSRAAAEVQARKEAEESAEASMRSAAAFVEQRDHLDRAMLQAVVDKHLRSILPG